MVLFFSEAYAPKAWRCLGRAGWSCTQINAEASRDCSMSALGMDAAASACSAKWRCPSETPVRDSGRYCGTAREARGKKCPQCRPGSWSDSLGAGSTDLLLKNPTPFPAGASAAWRGLLIPLESETSRESAEEWIRFVACGSRAGRTHAEQSADDPA